MFFGQKEFDKYFDVAPSGLNIPSLPFDKSKTKLKEGFSYVPSQAAPNPVFSFKKTTRVNAPHRGQKAAHDTYNVYQSDPTAGNLARKQQEYAAQLQSSADAAAAANRKQLLQIQSEKSAVSKMTEDYTAMLQKEADRRVKAQEKARISAATSAANQARQGQTANLQIQPASSTPQTAGTQAFKRRKDQFKISQRPRYMGIGGDVQMPGFLTPMINL